MLTCWSHLFGLYRCMPRKDEGRYWGHIGTEYLLSRPWKDEMWLKWGGGYSDGLSRLVMVITGGVYVESRWRAG